MAKPLATADWGVLLAEGRVTNDLRRATPDLGIALVAFGIYLASEAAYNHFRRPDPHR